MSLVLERLRKHTTNRPKKKRTLLSHLKSNLDKEATKADTTQLLEMLIKAEHIKIDDKKGVTYHVKIEPNTIGQNGVQNGSADGLSERAGTPAGADVQDAVVATRTAKARATPHPSHLRFYHQAALEELVGVSKNGRFDEVTDDEAFADIQVICKHDADELFLTQPCILLR